jgi:hypothetical protein
VRSASASDAPAGLPEGSPECMTGR